MFDSINFWVVVCVVCVYVFGGYFWFGVDWFGCVLGLFGVGGGNFGVYVGE